MENASKALVMAGMILIALLIISVGIYLFNTYSEFAYENEKKQAEQALIQYNTKFEKYVGQELEAQDVITIVNLAKDYNERKSEYPIEIIFNGRKVLKIDMIEFMEDDLDNNQKYKIKDNGITKNSDNIIEKIEIVKQ